MFSISSKSRFDAWTLIADVGTGDLASVLVYVIAPFAGGMMSFVPWMFFASSLYFFAGMARGQSDDCNLWLQAARINLVLPLLMLTRANGSGCFIAVVAFFVPMLFVTAAGVAIRRGMRPRWGH